MDLRTAFVMVVGLVAFVGSPARANDEFTDCVLTHNGQTAHFQVFADSPEIKAYEATIGTFKARIIHDYGKKFYPETASLNFEFQRGGSLYEKTFWLVTWGDPEVGVTNYSINDKSSSLLTTWFTSGVLNDETKLYDYFVQDQFHGKIGDEITCPRSPDGHRS